MAKMTEEDHRNLTARFKGMFLEDIKEALKPGRHNFSLLIDNVTKNLNAGTLIRSFNCFSGKHIILWGRKSINRVPCVASYKTEDIRVSKTIQELKSLIKELGISKVVALENNIDLPLYQLHKYKWNKDSHTLIILGNELGIDQPLFEIVDDFVEIKNYGATPSINLSAAGACAMFSYCSQMEI